MHGYWNGFWNRPWFARPAVWGLGAWALGSIFYDCGYATYSNPYYGSGGNYYDYSQPIQVVTQPTEVVVVQGDSTTGQPTDAASAPAEPPPAVLASQPHVDQAQEAFRAQDYAKAGAEAELAIKELPTDAALHEFRALVYFATGEFPQAAGTLYAVLSAGPGWDWTTMSGLYPGVEVYTKQLRALEAFVKAHPDAADARFVLAYHYITGTHKEAALKQLQQVIRLQPADQLTAQLIRSMGGEVPSPNGAQPPPAEAEVADEELPPPPDLDPAQIVGRRTAKRSDGTTFTLDLTQDNTFTWSFERAGKKQEFGGTYSIDGAVLVLERADKATMPGLVTMEGTGFNFKLFGAPEGDPGLDFKS
ncbi:MAG: tetratricopeptide repeat protein [Planctomycetales bacterium]